MSQRASTFLNFGVDYMKVHHDLMEKDGGVEHVISARSASQLLPQTELLSPCGIMFTPRLPWRARDPRSAEFWMRELVSALEMPGPGKIVHLSFAYDTGTGVVALTFHSLPSSKALHFCKELEREAIANGGDIW